MKNTFALGKGRNVILSQHIGDMRDYENFLFFDDNLKHFRKIFEINPEVITFDMHPEYLISKYAREIAKIHNLPSVEVQHHHAHIASCMAENFLSDREVIGVSFDGTGYGEDGKIWGAEFLICNYRKYERFAHLQYIPLPGGEKAIEEPWRTAVSYLYHTFGAEFFNLDIDFLKEIGEYRIESLIEMMKTNINCPLASSMGRLFDAISSLCCICHKSNYEGEAAIMLEMKINQEKGEPYLFEVEDEGGVKIIKFDGIIKGVVEDLRKKVRVENISLRFHLTVAEIIRRICRDIREKKGIREVVLSGGVFQNFFLLKKVYNSLKKDEFEVYTHNKVPPNDGGISLGQIAIASHLL
ncbi:carbamoyltransferase HypF [bacterium]|nr:carbamoyltransferase HypF [bacterium]